MNIYLAAPLFSDAEKAYNQKVARELEEAGFDVFLPQLGCPGSEGIEDIFECCIDNLKKCHVVVAILDGPQVDDGTAFEVGHAIASGTPVVGLRTDFRRVGEHGADINMMLKESVVRMCSTISEVIAALKDLA
jgi:nucleoside 2-deoxyribosyltransferase